MIVCDVSLRFEGRQLWFSVGGYKIMHCTNTHYCTGVVHDGQCSSQRTHCCVRMMCILHETHMYTNIVHSLHVKLLSTELHCRYKGDWSAGVCHGTGQFLYANGSQYSGQWVNNRKHGHAVFIYEDGHLFEGEFKGTNQAVTHYKRFINR
jgi:hypothetical protein